MADTLNINEAIDEMDKEFNGQLNNTSEKNEIPAPEVNETKEEETKIVEENSIIKENDEEKEETLVASKVTVLDEKVSNTPEIKPSNNVEKRFDANDFLKNLTVDLNDIEVVDANPFNKFDNFEKLMGSKSKTQIVAIQSGYIAYVEGYNYDEINALINSSLDDYGAQLLLCQTVFKSIASTNMGNMTFEDWIKNTSYYDLDSFIYGNYLETFPGTTSFNITCGSCGKDIEAKVNNDTLISTKNDETKAMLQHVLDNRNNPSELMKNAIIHTKKKIFLEDSKLVIEFKLPTIKKHLDLLASINKNARDKFKHILTFLLFIEKVLMLDVETSVERQKPVYNEVIDRNEKVNILKNLTFNDAKKLSTSINDMINRYGIEFKIKSFNCNACGQELGDIPVDMEGLLFFQMTQ